MPVSMPKPKVEHKPLAKCRVLYLGSAVPMDTVQGLEAVQKPLRDRYPLLDGTLPVDRALQGIDSWVTVFSTGIQLQYATDGNAFWFPIQNLYVSVAVKCITQTNGATGEVIGRFVPLDSMGARVNNGHPPLFACILRRTKGVKVLECHSFVCKSEQASFALVQACQYAYERKENWSESGDPPPVETLAEMGSSGAVKLVPANDAAAPENGTARMADLADPPPPNGYFFTKGDPNVLEYKLSQNGRPMMRGGPPHMYMRYPHPRVGRLPPPPHVMHMRPPGPRMFPVMPRRYYGPPPPWIRPPPIAPASVIMVRPPPPRPNATGYAASDPGYKINRVGDDNSGMQGRRNSTGSTSSDHDSPDVAVTSDVTQRARSSSSSSRGSTPRPDRQQRSDRPATPPVDYERKPRHADRRSRRDQYELTRQGRPTTYQPVYPHHNPEYDRYYGLNQWGPHSYNYDMWMERSRRAQSMPMRRGGSRSASRDRKGKGKKSKKGGKSTKHSRPRSVDNNGDREIVNPEDIMMRNPDLVPEIPRDFHGKRFMNEKAFSHSVPRIHDRESHPTAYHINQEFGERNELDGVREGDVTSNPLYDTSLPRGDEPQGDLENLLGYYP